MSDAGECGLTSLTESLETVGQRYNGRIEGSRYQAIFQWDAWRVTGLEGMWSPDVSFATEAEALGFCVILDVTFNRGKWEQRNQSMRALEGAFQTIFGVPFPR